MEKDPVCGMEINQQQAVATINYQGKMYYFCSSACQHLFEQHPENYTDQQAAQA